MTVPSSTAVSGKSIPKKNRLVFMVVFLLSALVLALWWGIKTFNQDSFIKATLALQGSGDQGAKLFRMNCAGCHGIKAQGFVGPDLHNVSLKNNDSQIINQVIKGRTPPMPRFELEPQTMADLLAHLHSLN